MLNLNLFDLFLKAVGLWLEYIQFSIGGMGDENGIENIRLICEKAIAFAGLHVSKGYALWEAYREFETALLAGYQVLLLLLLVLCPFLSVFFVEFIWSIIFYLII
jgi:hypothetical protein